MPAKKKRTRSAEPQRVRKTPTVTLRTKALDVLARLRDADVNGYIQKAEDWRKRMEAAEAQLKSGEVALLEMSKTVGVMNRSLTVEREKLAATQARDDQHLTAIRELVDAKLKDRAEAEAEIAYWKGEVTRLHNDLIEIHRERAREAVNPPSDDLQDIQALQNLASWRGGLAMDDAQKRAADFNTEQRIRELEHEIVRLRRTLPDRLQAMVEQAEADGLYEKLDVTAEQVRIVELETELSDVKAAHDALARDLGKSNLDALGIIERDDEIARLRAFRALAARWLLTLEQEHEKASHQDEDTRQISSQTCHVCAGIDALWQAIKEERRKTIRKAGKTDRKVLDRLRDHDRKP